MLELCGGKGGITKVACKRGLSSGGNLDKTCHVDLGNREVQRVVIHYLNTCTVTTVVLQPNCRTTRLPSYFNAQVNYETWLEHHKEDLPHITFCGVVATLQYDKDRYFLREQPTGTWVDEIEPWKILSCRDNLLKINIDQCMTGLKDSYGIPIKKPTEMYANHPALLDPFNKYKCDGSHYHSQVCNKELAAAAQYTHNMQNAIVSAVAAASKLHRSGNRPRGEPIYVINCKGFDLDDPTIPRHSSGVLKNKIIRQPERGFGCSACADKKDKYHPSHDRNP